MSYAFFGIISILAAWKWGNWKNWKEYYPTILYFFVGNLVYMVLTQSKSLWNFGEILGHYPVFEVTMMVLLYPSTVILFLSFYPKAAIATKRKQVIYMLLCTLIFSAMEYLASITGGFSYSNGWNFFHSFIFNAVLFPLLYLHFKKPLIAWPISGVLAFVVLFLFDIPFRK